MATKTISVRIEAYEKLKGARRYTGESFSEIVLRARWPESSLTGSELASRYRSHGPFFSEQELDRIEKAKQEATLPQTSGLAFDS